MRWCIRHFSLILISGAISIFSAALPAQSFPATIEFDIPAQDLAGALQAFSDQSRIQLIYAPENVAGRNSPGLQGGHPPLEALRQLLGDTGLEPRASGENTIVLAAPLDTDIAQSESAAPRSISRPPLEEVIVSASRRGKLLGKLPMSVTVLSGEDLRAGQVRDIPEVANWLPSLHLDSPQTSSYSIRGLSGTATGGRAVDFLIDGATATTVNVPSNPAMLDVERIEVIRGSQGTLYGQNSLAGTIKLVSVRPRLGVWEGRVNLAAWAQSDGDDSWQGQAVLNVPMGESAAARLGILHEDHGGFIDIYLPDPLTALPGELVRKDGNKVERTAWRGAVLWQLTERFSAYLTARRQTLERPWFQRETQLRDPPGGDRIRPFPERLSNTSVRAWLLGPEDDETIGTLEAVYDFDSVSLISETTRYELDKISAASLENPLPTITIESVSDVRQAQDNFSQEFRLVSADNERFEWLAGAYWREEDYELESFQGGVTTGVDSRFFETIDRSQVALYGNVMIRFRERLALELGLRWFDEDVDRFRIFELSLPDLEPTEQITDGSGNFDTTAPRMALSWDLEGGNMLYGSVAKGFRGGTINLSQDLPPPLQSTGPDKNYAYEIGLKGRWLDGRLTGQFALFYNDWQDIQVRVLEEFNGQFFNIAVNGESAHTAGLEYHLTWQPRDTVRLTLAGHFMDSELDSSVRGQQDASAAGIRAGNELTDAPRYGVTLAADLVRPLASGRQAFARVYLLARDGVWSSLGNERVSKTDSYAQGDLHLGIRSGPWEISFFAKNIWDERANLFQSTNFVFDNIASSTVILPRRVGLAARFDF